MSEAEQQGAHISAKASVVDAAVDLFARKGFTKTSVREIAEMAGVAKPTLYYYFGSKQGLGIAILRRATGVLDDEIGRRLAATEGIVERLIAFIEAHFEACRHNEKLARFLYAATFAPPDGPAGFDIPSVHREARQRLESMVDEGIGAGLIRSDARDEAVMGLMGIINIHLMNFLVQGLELSRQTAHRSVHALLGGVGNHASKGWNRTNGVGKDTND